MKSPHEAMNGGVSDTHRVFSVSGFSCAFCVDCRYLLGFLQGAMVKSSK